MSDLFSPEYQLIWTVVLAVLLFFPVRKLIWVLSVRRLQAKNEGELPSEEEQLALKRRAGFTAALLSFIFSYFYTAAMLGPS